ncbi:MAG: bifunctional 4-hydroxy-3-methylbut-2-enyl diphosphate reductase/30S ribosomal protein S1 [Defluviitaleaceae bacterium]|nr:bifunctional 4-hydroxy-3-methylbut-2-enyl diphosphate reductase/30S ribosomal protein S1 [Defluviitaleaceae bacterium]
MTFEMAKTAGFCFGVARAVRTVTELSACERLCTYGPLINNRIVTGGLEARGVPVIDDLSGADGAKVAIRSHGVPESVYAELDRLGLEYVDCTCPDVKKIHAIAGKSRSEGHTLIIIGDAGHPEIKGIMGYAGEARVYAGLEEMRPEDFHADGVYDVVFQTTYDKSKFSAICAWLEKIKAGTPGLNLTIHDTVCGATAKRQAEAREIARRSDVMIVLGDASSSNTDKLYRICKENCERTYLVETIKEFQLNILHPSDKIGLTAGASTPPEITKEAVELMSDLVNNNNGVNNSQSFEEMLDEALVTLHTGDIVKGTVIQVTPADVSVNLGYKSDGIIMKSEVSDDPAADITKILKPGDVIDVFVVRVNDGEGNVLLSKKKIDAQKGMMELEEAFQNKTPVEGKITEVVKGGVIANIKGARAFIPSKQVSDRYVEDLETLKGKTFDFNILEFDRSKRRLVAGRRELAAAEKERAKTEIFSKVEVGQIVKGKVSRVAAFGAFVDLGGVDGLIHISELAWSRVRKVTDVVKEGDEVEAAVVAVDPEKGKISLSLRGVTQDPWKTAAEKYAVGALVEGKVARLVPFGAFVELEDGVDGLIHISQIANHRVAKPEDELTVGQTVQVVVTEVSGEAKKISLSKRAADDLAERGADYEEPVGEEIDIFVGEPLVEAAESDGYEIMVVLEPDEVEAVAKLAAEIWNEYYTPLIGKEQVDYMLDKFQSAVAIYKQIKEEGCRYYLAEVAHKPAAYCAVKFDPETRVVFLSKLYVEAGFRQRGLAKAMIENFAADYEPVKTIWLTVNKGNAGTIAAYEKMGFKTTDELVTDIGGGYVMDDYKMELELEE